MSERTSHHRPVCDLMPPFAPEAVVNGWNEAARDQEHDPYIVEFVSKLVDTWRVIGYRVKSRTHSQAESCSEEETAKS